MFFEGFTLETVGCGEVTLRVRHGGGGPPVVLLHGHPRTHATRHRVAKRAMASDVVALMDALGHERFAVAGHDRGGYVAFQLALDHPERVAALTVMGRAVPMIEALDRTDRRFASDWWHWFFLGQTTKPAEDAIAAIGPESWYRPHGPEVMGAEAHEDLWTALRDPAVVHGMCEDYRAELAIDVEHAEADRAAGRRVDCPVQVIRAAREDLGLFGDDPREPLRDWAGDVRGLELDCGHHMAEELPEATAQALSAFWADAGWG
jgi:haloacetate dehalogenase